MSSETMILALICTAPIVAIIIGITMEVNKKKAKEAAEEVQRRAAYMAWSNSPKGQAENRKRQLEQEFHDYLLSIKPPEIIPAVKRPQPLNLDTSSYRSRGNTGQHRKSPDDAWDNVNSFVASQAEYNGRETARFEAENEAYEKYRDYVFKHESIYRQWLETKRKVTKEWQQKYDMTFFASLPEYDDYFGE